MTLITEEALEHVARNVRAARTAAGWSLDALAARAEISKGSLVALEGGRGNPTLTTLVRLSNALGLSITALIEDERADPVRVVDLADIAPLWRGPGGGTAHLLLTNHRPLPVEVWRWVLHPGERHDSLAHPSGVTETLTVIRGQMRLVLGETERPLRAGQTTTFASDVPHAYAGAGRGACELVMTVHLPPEHRTP